MLVTQAAPRPDNNKDSMCAFGFCSIYRQDNQKFETECTKAMEKLRSSEV